MAVEWAAAEGWNPGVDDAERFLAADPEGFLLVEEGGEPAGTVSLVRYDERYAFLGLFIVRPDLRGRRIGAALFDRALELAGDRVVGLDGVEDQQPYYERRGFVALHGTRRREAAGGGEAPAGLVEARDVPFEALAAYDASIFSVRRDAFLRGWIDRPAGEALAAVGEDGVVRGLGVLRRCGVGAKAGPLFADDAETAERLLRGLLAAAGEGTPVYLDLPDVNAAAVALADRVGMPSVFDLARMERGGRSATDWSRTYGVTTLELG